MALTYKARCRGVIATVLGVATLLAACGGTDSPAPAPGSQGTGTSAVSGNRKVAILASVSNPYLIMALCSAKQELTKAGYSTSIQYPSAFDPSVQIPILNSVINSRPAGLLLAPADPKALAPPVQQAARQGIKVVTVDTTLSSSDGLASVVVTNNRLAGKQAADLIGESTKGRQGDVALLTFSPGAASVADDRAEGFRNEIKKYPNLHFIGTTITTTSPADAASKTNAILAAHPNLVGILGTFSGASIGMVQALRQRGVTTKQVISVANDGDAALMQAIRSGYLYGSVLPRVQAIGAQAGQQLVNALNGRATKSRIVAEPVTATNATLDDPAVVQSQLKNSPRCSA